MSYVQITCEGTKDNKERHKPQPLTQGARPASRWRQNKAVMQWQPTVSPMGLRGDSQHPLGIFGGNAVGVNFEFRQNSGQLEKIWEGILVSGNRKKQRWRSPGGKFLDSQGRPGNSHCRTSRDGCVDRLGGWQWNWNASGRTWAFPP